MKRLRTLGAAIALASSLIGGPAFLAAPAHAVTCLPATATPTDSYPGTTVMANNFESGTLSGFTVNTGGDGTASVSSAQAFDGACSAYLHVTSNSGSLANFSTALPSGTQQVYADGWFNITTAGLSGSDVPYFRFFSGSTRFADVYRYNNNGQLWLRVLAPNGTFTYTELLSSSISLSAWHHVVMHVVPNGSATTIEVWFDGTQVYSSTQVNTVTSAVTSVQNGSEHTQQMGDEYIDDLIVKAITTPAAAPVASFTATPTSGTAPLNVAFKDTSTGSPTSWSWTFGDGGTSTAQNPTHTYANAGTYTATLTATNASGSSSSSTTITVNQAPPVASFTASPTSGTAPLKVAFTDTSTGSPTSWSWNFGDSGTAIPSYDHIVVVLDENTAYETVNGSTSAPYLNSLANNGAKMTQSFGISHPSEPNYLSLYAGSTFGITADPCPQPETGTNLGDQLVAAGKTFKGYSEGLDSAGSTECSSTSGYVARHAPWTNFPNGASYGVPFTQWPTDFTQLPSVSFVIPNLCDDASDCALGTADTWLQSHMDTYAQWAKTHNSLLITTFDEDDSSHGNHIFTTLTGQGVVQGSYAQTLNHYGVLGLIEDSMGLSRINNAFGQPSVIAPFSPSTSTSTLQNPTHTYSTAGTYTATLTATNAGGSSTSSKTITVNPAPPPAPVASFTASPTSGTAPLNVTFTDTSTGSPTSWSWAFGDGGTSTAQNPTHTYANAGTYTATLTATNSTGSSTSSTTITVSATPPPPQPPAAPTMNAPSVVNLANVAAVPVSGTAEAASTVKVTASDGAGHTVSGTTTAASNGSWSLPTIDLRTLNDGTVTLTATATNTAGTSPATTATASKDTVPPAAPTLTVPATVTAANVTSVSVSGTAEAGSTISLKVTDTGAAHTVTGSAKADGSGNWSITGLNLTSLNDGQLTYTATATDAAGNTGAAATQTGTKKTTAQAPQFTSVPSQITSDTVSAVQLSGTSDPRATVALTATDSASHTISATATANDSGTWSATMNLSTLNSGSVTFSAQATDIYGNVSAVTTATSRIGPKVVSVTLQNGGTAGKADANDKVVIVFNEPMSPSSFCSSWTSATGPWTQKNSNVSVLITHNTAAPNDTLTVSTGCTTSNFGTVNLGASYTTSTGGNLTFKGSRSRTESSVSLSADGKTLTITLGELRSGTPATGVVAGTPTYQGNVSGQTGIATDTSGVPLGTKPSGSGSVSGF